MFLDREVIMDNLRNNYPVVLLTWLAVAALAAFAAIAHALLESQITMS